MTSFATGVLGALILAAGTYFAMQAGTITAVERFDDDSTLIDGIWESWFREPVEAVTAPDGA
ncbi:MAG TPA: hypothetical protein VFJ13_08470 [Paracoccaceae bacterium]|nr:hypothetical protein [Paracoccaceae bacterium]